jgi:arylsulfatase
MRGHKGCVHEGGTRVPFFVQWPGHIPNNTDMDHLTRHVDYFPTFAALAGAKTPSDLDGRNLVPWLENPQTPWTDRKTFFHIGRWGKEGIKNWCIGSCDPDDSKYKNFAVRTEQWQLHGPHELYDIRKDRGETTNVFDQYPEVAQKLLDAYGKWWDEVRPMMVNEEVPLSKEKPIRVLYNKQKKEKGIPDWKPPKI